MAGTFLLDQLVQVAAARGAVVRLLGDDRQLPAVEGGGALRLVAVPAGHPAADHPVPVPRPRRGRRHAPAPHRRPRRRRLVPRRRAHPVRVTRGDDRGRLRRLEERHARREGHPDGRRRQRRRHRAVRPGPRRPRRRRAGRGRRGAAARREPRRDAGTGSSPASTSGGWPLFGGRDWVKNGDAWHVARRLDDGSLRRPAPRPRRARHPARRLRRAPTSSCCTRPPRTAPRAPPSTPPTPSSPRA